MWILVLFSMLMPWRMQSNLAVMDTTEKIQEVSFRDDYYRISSEYKIIRQTENHTQEQIRQIDIAKNKTDLY